MTIKPVVSALTVIPALLHGDVDIAGGQYPSYIATQAKGLAQMRILAAGFALGPRVNEILAPATGTFPHQRQPGADPAGRQPDAAIRAAEAVAQRQADDRGLTVTASGTAPAA